MGSHVNENEVFFKHLINARAYGPGQATTKFERNPCNRFGDNRFARRTTEFRFHELC